MKTYFDYLAVCILFFVPYVLAIVAFRAIRDRELTSVKAYKHVDEHPWSPYWQYFQAACFVSGLRRRWTFMGLSPWWSLGQRSNRHLALDVISWKVFVDTLEYNRSFWYKDDEKYLLVRRPDRTVLIWLTVIDILLVSLLGAALGIGTFTAKPAATPVATQAAAIPTIQIVTPRTRPTATPVPAVNGDSIVIDLGQQAPGDALLQWINGLPGPNLPALPSALEDWLNSLPWPEVAAIQLPEGMDGFVVVARWGDGFELVRLDQYGNPVGSPVALSGTKEFTLHARELKWGVRYSDKFRVTDESQGHVDVYVAESGEPTMAAGYHLYNFRWWHLLILVIVAMGIVAAYRFGSVH